MLILGQKTRYCQHTPSFIPHKTPMGNTSSSQTLNSSFPPQLPNTTITPSHSRPSHHITSHLDPPTPTPSPKIPQGCIPDHSARATAKGSCSDLPIAAPTTDLEIGDVPTYLRHSIDQATTAGRDVGSSNSLLDVYGLLRRSSIQDTNWTVQKDTNRSDRVYRDEVETSPVQP